jgi:hypothetical protein
MKCTMFYIAVSRGMYTGTGFNGGIDEGTLFSVNSSTFLNKELGDTIEASLLPVQIADRHR